MIIEKNQKQIILAWDLDDTLFDSTAFQQSDIESWMISVFDGVKDVLVNKKFKHILVTKGENEHQDKKLDVLGIKEHFDEIYVVSEDIGKYERFKAIVDNNKDAEVIVIGNRIDAEIRYGNMLGLKTILVNHGKYTMLEPKDKFEVADHIIETDSFHLLHDIEKMIDEEN